jgi:tripartite-type tricarboxylate transporter receptor subunit TctC
MRYLFAAIWLLIAPAAALAEYPEGPVTIVVPFPAGGPTDLAARVLVEGLSSRLGQPVIIENRVGAAGITGTTAVANAKPDGRTLLLALSTHTINPAVFANLPYNFLKDFTGVAMIVKSAFVLTVNPSIPANDVNQLVGYMKTHDLKYASAGIGSINHLGMELLTQMTGTKALHIPYKGAADANTAVLGGHVDMGLAAVLTAAPLIENKSLKALGVTSQQSLGILPDVPPLSAELPGYELLTWFGIVAPTGTPKDVIAKLNTAINEVVATPEVSAKLAEIGGDRPVPGTPEDLDVFVRKETDKWEKIAREAGVPRQ